MNELTKSAEIEVVIEHLKSEHSKITSELRSNIYEMKNLVERQGFLKRKRAYLHNLIRKLEGKE